MECIGSAGSARSIGFTGSIRSTRSDLVDPLSREDPRYSVDPPSVHLFLCLLFASTVR